MANLLEECSYLMSEQSCSIHVQIDFDKRTTTLNITSSTDYVETTINAVASIEVELNIKDSFHAGVWRLK